VLTSKLRSCARTLGLAALVLNAACAPLSHIDRSTGTCALGKSECDARCERLTDLDDRAFCEEDCRRTSVACEGPRALQAGMQVDSPPRVTDYGPAVASRVLLNEGRLDSNGPNVAFTGGARAVEGAWEVLPGRLMRVTFALPSNTREAELLFDHGCGGQPCFVTASLGDQALTARYAPPRRLPGGKLHRDVWPVTPLLPAPDASAPEGATRPLSLVVYNNAEAGSLAPWLVGRVVLYHRALAR